MQLVIAEKPSVARDLARVLGVRATGRHSWEGAGRVITWCIGHLVELDEPAAYDARWKAWRLDTLPMIPDAFKLRPVPGTRDQLRVVRDLLRDRRFSEVVNGCDAGREGELIFRYVYELARSRLAVRRLWISSLTEEAIRDGFARLRPGAQYDALADAARCRSEADWLVGMNATRAVTISFRRAGAPREAKPPVYSIGRVQTPTLAIIVRREQAIRAFQPRDYWEVRGTFATATASADGADKFVAQWMAPADARKRSANRFGERALADQVRGARARARGGDAPGGADRRARDAKGFARAAAVALRSDVVAAHGQPSLRAQRVAHARGGAGALRASQDLDLPAHRLALPAGRSGGRAAQALLGSGKAPGVRAVRAAAAGSRADRARASAAHLRRHQGARPSRHHSDRQGARSRRAVAGRAPHLRSGRASIPGRVSSRCRDRAHRGGRARGRARRRRPGGEHGIRTIRSSRRCQRRRIASLRADGFVWSQAGKPSPASREKQRRRARQGEGPRRRRSGAFAAAVGGAAARRPLRGPGPPDAAAAAAYRGDVAGGDGIGGPRDRGRSVARRHEGHGPGHAGDARRDNRDVAQAQVHRARRQAAGRDADGIALIERLPVPTLASPELTGAWEARLARISRGQEARATFMADIARYVRETTDAIRGARPRGKRTATATAPASRDAASPAPTTAPPATTAVAVPALQTGHADGGAPRVGLHALARGLPLRGLVRDRGTPADRRAASRSRGEGKDPQIQVGAERRGIRGRGPTGPGPGGDTRRRRRARFQAV